LHFLSLLLSFNVLKSFFTSSSISYELLCLHITLERFQSFSCEPHRIFMLSSSVLIPSIDF
jgi:hypothetical protein